MFTRESDDMTDEETAQDMRSINPCDNWEEWERHIEERAYLKYENRIKQFQCEAEYYRKMYEQLVSQLTKIEMLKPPSPIYIMRDGSINTDDIPSNNTEVRDA